MLLALRQFFLLVWKGSVLRRRHFIVTIFEILIPLTLTIFFLYLRSILGQFTIDSQRPARTFEVFNPLTSFPYGDSEYMYLFYTPKNNLTTKLTFRAHQKLQDAGLRKLPRIRGFNSEAILNFEAIGTQMNMSYSKIFAVVYQNFDEDSLPKNLVYKLRINQDFQTSSKYQPFSGNGPTRADEAYRSASGFLCLQSAIDQSFIELRTSNLIPTPKFQVGMQTYAYPPYYNQMLFLSFVTNIPAMIIFGYSIMGTVFVKRLVVEKQNRAKEMMRMMGLNDFVYFSGTFFNTFFLTSTILTLTTLSLKIPLRDGLGVFNHTDGFLVWIILMLYAANGLLLCMATSVFINKPVVASIVTYILWILTYCLPRFLMDPPGQERTYMNFDLSAKLATCLLPNAALHWACRIMAFYEGTAVGSNWTNLSTPAPGDTLSLAAVIGMMLLSSCLYVFIIWYVDNVWPWQFGIPKHPLYLFMPSYWKPEQVGMTSFGDYEELTNAADKNYFEKEPEDKVPGIALTNLTKVFGWGSSRKVAVNNVTLNMYHGQITALLGHNGAGKTTTLNVMTVKRTNFQRDKA